MGEYKWHQNKKDNSVLNECIIFGFRHDLDVIEVLNYCVLYAKYYIYIHLYSNNKLDLFVYMSQLNYAMEKGPLFTLGNRI